MSTRFRIHSVFALIGIVVASNLLFFHLTVFPGGTSFFFAAQSCRQEKGNQVVESDFIVTALTRVANELCATDFDYPPLNYSDCPPDSILNIIPLVGGMTNALKLILMGALMSHDEGRCFYVDESRARLNPLKNGTKAGFIQKYMEPIGLTRDHPFVQRAYMRRRVRTQVRWWNHYLNNMTLGRTLYKEYPDIPMIGYASEAHQLKRVFIRRMWRLLPLYRESTCKSLLDYDLGGVEFMAFSVRRGDKGMEGFVFTPLSEYIEAAEDQKKEFGGIVPKIFVATDDCRVMNEFRDLRPDWVFVSECDKDQKQQQSITGFVLGEVHQWDKDTEDAHFRKFFVEIYALVISKVYVGVGYTNVAWWIFFLRPFHYNFILLDKPETRTFLEHIVEYLYW
jgi:hypothetical protein